MSRPVPNLESVSTDNTDNAVTSPKIYHFTNGQSVLYKYAAIRKYNGIFSIWGADKNVIQPQYNYAISLMGFGFEHYGYTDLVYDTERVVRDKVKACGEHTVPAVTAIAKADNKNVKPTIIDSDNFKMVKPALIKGNLRLGVILHSDKECGLFRRECTINEYVKEDTKKSNKKDDSKENDINEAINPFALRRRQQFVERLGLNVADMNWIIDNKAELGKMVKRIHSRHILFSKAPKTALTWAKRLVMSKSGDVERIPIDIRKMMHSEMTNDRKAKVNEVMNDLGIIPPTDEEDIDIKPNAYTLRHSNYWNECFLRNWSFLGSIDGIKWNIIKKHINDISFEQQYQSNTFKIEKSNEFYYSKFKIKLDGKNSSGRWNLVVSGLEIYGEMIQD